MALTSLGFHTLTVYRSIDYDDKEKLVKDFEKYRDSTGKVAIIYPGGSKYNDSCYEVFYNDVGSKTDKKVGILWKIRKCNGVGGFTAYQIEATINPKVLSGITDYITAATGYDLTTAASNFNAEAAKISRIIGKLYQYKIKRIDYCINFNLKELQIECTTEQMMELIKRSNVPPFFSERATYDSSSHRMKTDDNSFYLQSNSVTINCYDKYAQLKKEHPDNPSIADAYNTIRFEVQCKYQKTYALKYKLRLLKFSENYGLVADDVCRDVATSYFSKIIYTGDYYTLADAVAEVKSCKFRNTKERRLTDTLNLISQSRGILKAREKLTGNNLIVFHRAISELTELKINPVTIPREWGIRHITNLLGAYLRTELQPE
jgi:hypothetical protein